MKHLKLFNELNEAEGLDNIGILHKDAGAERVNQWQKDNANTKIEEGDWIKKAFVDGTETEWMWVNVTKIISQDEFEGKIDNEPIVVGNVKLGDVVTVKRSEIAQLIKKD